MTTGKSGVIGQVPKLLIGKAKPRINPEREKYIRLWETEEYRKTSHGEETSRLFLSQSRVKPGSTVIDFGCGTGRGALMIALFGRCRVEMIDFAPNCLDPEVRQALTTQAHALAFHEADLERPLPIAAKYGFCVDVMEHIPEEKVKLVLENILRAAEHVFFQVSTQQDKGGELIGEALHLTVKPFEWWNKTLRDLGCVTHFASEYPGCAVFYVTAWVNAKEISKRGKVNTPQAQVLDQIEANCKLEGINQAKPHERQDTEIMILGGGYSLKQFWPEIIEKRAGGMPMVTINGTYNEANAKGLKPSAQIVVDAREFNKRFVVPTVEGCKYLIASQCHPSVFEAVPKSQTYMWHSVISPMLTDFIDRQLGDGKWFPVPGGSTAMLRGICLLRMLGFYRFHIYGFDSCLMDGEHHAYVQTENEDTNIVPVTCGDKIFMCHLWMASQAQEFQEQVRMMGDEVNMIVYGDGLISHIIRTGAELQVLEDEAAQQS